jgi:O-succinylbenzoic acid--CoA ligase
VAAGDSVATTLPPGVELVALLHAAAIVGAALVPLDPRLRAAERRVQIAQVEPSLVVDEPLGGAEAELDPRHGRGQPDAAWTILFTSGTTGRPKPVALSHRNHLASAIGAAWALGVAPDDRWLCVLPMFHVGGLAIAIRSALYGTTAVVHERFDADHAAAAIASGDVSLASVIPTMLHRLADAGLEGAPALRAILLGGAPAAEDLVRWAADRNLPVVRTYGMTETASQIATEPLCTGQRGGARVLPGVDLRTGPREEILVRGPMVARGSLAADGWLHTGDRGRLDSAGLLYVDGRLDDVIITGGENVSPSEIERALLEHPAVADAGVVGAFDREWGEAVVALVVPAPGASPSAEELRDHCRARLAGHKIPKRVGLVSALPRNAQGKLVRARLGEAARSAS